ncbi:MAG TPA: GDP-L-fucose synthase [bacterium]|nr:GDP-L-fucose synthase [bacterium]
MASWAKKRIIVTGGSGFLGGHLVRQLRQEGAVVRAPSSKECDLLRFDQAARLFDEGPDVVFHLAARVGGIDANRQAPGTFFRDNLLMGIHVLEACRQKKVGRLVQVGTVCSYPKHTPVPFREEALFDGYPEETNAPYGIAKRALLVGGRAYEKEFGLSVVNVLLLNLYGEEDHFDLETSHVIPALIRKCLEAKEEGRTVVDVWGDGNATRGFLYVRDAARGIAAAGLQLKSSEPVNLGAPGEISIRDLAQCIGELCGYTGTFRFDPSKPAGQPRRSLDCEKAERLFGFRAQTTLRDGLQRTIEWTKARREQEKLFPQVAGRSLATVEKNRSDA